MSISLLGQSSRDGYVTVSRVVMGEGDTTTPFPLNTELEKWMINRQCKQRELWTIFAL